MKRVLAAICLLLLIVGGALAWKLRPRHVDFLTDAGTIREPAATAAIREILWQPPTLLASGLNTHADEYEPRVSADGRTLYFVRGRPGANTDIFSARKTGAGWSDPALVAAINSEFDDLGPEPSPDGGAIYFYSDREGGSGGYDLWMSRLTEDGWGAPINLGSGVNSPYNDYGPAISMDGRTLCFASNRRAGASAAPEEGSWRATLREDLYERDYDLYLATIGDAGVSGARALAALNSPTNEGSPAFSPAGDFLYFCSDRPGGAGGFDIFRARLIAGKFDDPKALGSEVNTSANELDPALAMGGYALHFSSDRPPKPDSVGAVRGYDLYQTQSREVYRDVEVRQASINWAALWAQIRPSLLWAILALILSLLLITLLRDLRGGRLSLLGKCLLASLLVHTLLMLLFNVMQVSTAIAGALRRSDKIRISLASVVRADDLAMQIRGSLTDAPDARLMDAPAPSRMEASLEVPPAQIARLEVGRANSPPERPVINADAQDAPKPESAFSPTDAPPPPITQNLSTIDTPDELIRSVATERAMNVEPNPSMPAATPRMRVQIVTSRPANESVMRLSPAAIDAAPSIAVPILPTEAPGDVTPRFAAMPQSPSAPDVPATTTAMRMTGFNLPATVGGSQTAERETIVKPDSPKAEMPRADLPFSTPDSSTGARLRHIAPDLSRYRDPGASMAGHSAPTKDAVSAAALAGQPAPPVEAPSWSDAKTMIDAPRSDAGPAFTIESPIASDDPTQAPTPAPPRAAPGGAFEIAPMPIAPLAKLGPERRNDSPEMSSLAAAPAIAESQSQPGVSPTPVPEEGPESSLTSLAMLDLALPQDVETQAEAPADGVVGRPVAGSPEGETPIAVGTLVGRVVDADTGQPLHGAEVRLDIPDTAPIIAVTSRSRRYELHAPRMPDFFAVSASHQGYTPQTANASSDRMRGRTLDLDFALKPVSEFVVALEEEPTVHHLGNDLFEGRINSRFQRRSEGRFLAATFTLSRRQLPPHYRSAQIELMTKGVQCPHKVRINGKLLDVRLDESPHDGSFGELRIEFDPVILKEGENALVLRAVSCRGDLDDFEFVNVRIRLNP